MSARSIVPLLCLAILLAAAGAGIAGYLTAVHYAGQPIACSNVGDCELVNSSRYASVGGVPVAALGLAAYVTIGALTAAAAIRRDATPLSVAWALALASFAFSMYLTYIELRVLHAICVYCVASASIVSVLLVVLSAALTRATGPGSRAERDRYGPDTEKRSASGPAR